MNFFEKMGQSVAPPGTAGMKGAEDLVYTAAQWLKLALEGSGAVIIGIGFAIAAFLFIKTILFDHSRSFTTIRLVLARHLALALEFQLGADILTTAVAPSWDQIGKLAAIAVIRTGLNFFLSREMRDEQRELVKPESAPLSS